jgi:hypothetical protein
MNFRRLIMSKSPKAAGVKDFRSVRIYTDGRSSRSEALCLGGFSSFPQAIKQSVAYCA